MPRPPAPIIDHPYVFSVSQIETFQLCPRKWAFEKLDGLERKSNKFAELGGRVHDVLEDYLKKAKPIDTSTVEGRIAKPGIKYLPFPKTPGMRVEKWFSIVFGVAAYRGLKDVEIIQDQRARPLVLDHKSTRSWNWKKTREQLLKDTQAGIYAADAMVKTGAQEVDLNWVYYKTEGKPDSDLVDTVINRKQVSEILTRTDQTARRMIKVINSCNKAMDVTPNFGGCSAFGGCSFRETHCKPKPVQVLKAIMAQKIEESRRAKGDTSAFLKDLENRKKKKAGATNRRDPEPEEIDVDDVDLINSPDREEFEQPPPPPAKKINGKYVNAEWDDDAAEWKFPEEVEKAEKAEQAAKKAAEKKSKTPPKTDKPKKSAKDILASVGKKKAEAEVERIEEEEEEDPETEVADSSKSEEATILEAVLDLLADKIAARLK